MLQLNGKCLGRKAEIIQAQTGPFEKVTARIMAGTGFDTETVEVQFGRDYPASSFPAEGEDVSLNVYVGVYSGRNGVGYRLTAISRNHDGKRANPAA